MYIQGYSGMVEPFLGKAYIDSRKVIALMWKIYILVTRQRPISYPEMRVWLEKMENSNLKLLIITCIPVSFFSAS